MRPKPTAVQISGPFIFVKYSYRQTPDLYVAMKGHPVYCTQCEEQFGLDKLVSHIAGHDRRKNKPQL